MSTCGNKFNAVIFHGASLSAWYVILAKWRPVSMLRRTAPTSRYRLNGGGGRLRLARLIGACFVAGIARPRHITLESRQLGAAARSFGVPKPHQARSISGYRR